MKFLMLFFVFNIFISITCHAQPVTKAMEEAAFKRGDGYAKKIAADIAGKSQEEASPLIAKAINEYIETDKIGGAYILISIKGNNVSPVDILKSVEKENRVMIKSLSSYIVTNYKLVHDVRGRQPELPWPATLPRPDVYGTKAKALPVAPESKVYETLLNEVIVLYNQAEYEKAAVKAEAAVKESPARPVAYYNLGLIYSKLKENEKAITAYQNAIVYYGDNIKQKSTALYNIATLYYGMAKYEKAYENYTTAINLLPSEGLYYSGRFYANCKLGRSTEAENDKQAANAKGYQFTGVCQTETDKNISADLANAMKLLEAEKYDEAIKIYDQVLAKNPNSFVANSNKGVCLFRSDDKKGALIYFIKADKLEPGNADNLVNIAWSYYHLKKYKETIEAANKAISLKPTLPTAHEAKARAHMQLYEYPIALKAYNEVINLGDKTAVNYANRGTCNYETENIEAALRDFNEAIRLNPAQVYSLKERAKIFTEEKRYDEALKDYDALIKLNPENAQYEVDKGLLFHNQKKYAEAIPYYRNAIQKNKSSNIPYANLGAVLFKLNRLEEALAVLDTAVSLFNKDAYTFYYRAQTLIALKREDEAMTNIDSVLKINPAYEEAILTKSFLLGRKEQYLSAIVFATSYIALKPNNPGGYQNRGIYNYNLKLYDQAIADCTKWIELDPKNYQAYLKRSQAYCAKGLKGLAEEDEKKVVSLGGYVATKCKQ